MQYSPEGPNRCHSVRKKRKTFWIRRIQRKSGGHISETKSEHMFHTSFLVREENSCAFSILRSFFAYIYRERWNPSIVLEELFESEPALLNPLHWS